jgi:methionyl-tRNA synthetase
VNRTLSFVTRYYDGKIPDGSPDGKFWGAVRKYEEDIAARLDRADLRDAFHLIFELSSFANKAFQDGEPWRTRREDPQAAERLIRNLAFVVRDLAVMIEPYMPQAAERIAGFFGLSFGQDPVYRKEEGRLSWDSIGRAEGAERVLKCEVLFAKLEDDRIAVLRERYSGSQKEREEAGARSTEKQGAAEPPPAPAEPPELRVPKIMDLRVAKIVRIERHPKADKLYIETLDIAGEERVIVSGLVPFYKEEELLNKHIIVAYNLKPATLRGVESRGMLLAASDRLPGGSERVEALDASGVPTGTRVAIEGGAEAVPPGEIDIDAFFSVPIEVRDHRVLVNGRALTLDGKPVMTARIPEGEVR